MCFAMHDVNETPDGYSEFEEREERKSKSQLKREMHELQAMGERLVELPESDYARFDLPSRLVQALKDCKKTKKHEARRRQIQYIGGLMREIDAEPVREFLADVDAGRRMQARNFHQVESWRDRIVDGDDELVEELIERFGHEHRQQLWQLSRNARKERAAAKPPKSFRALFKLLRQLHDQSN